MEAAGVVAELLELRIANCGLRIRRSSCGSLAEEEDLSVAEVERGFDGLQETRLFVGRKFDAILNNEEVSGLRERLRIVEQIINAVGLERRIRPRNQGADVRLPFETLQDFRPGEI